MKTARSKEKNINIATPGPELSQRYLDLFAGHQIVVEELFAGDAFQLGFDAAAKLEVACNAEDNGVLLAWATHHETIFLETLWDRYLVCGLDLQKSGTACYHRLPHYFLVSEVIDRQTGVPLSTVARNHLLAGAPILPVPTLYRDTAPASVAALIEMASTWVLQGGAGVTLKIEDANSVLASWHWHWSQDVGTARPGDNLLVNGVDLYSRQLKVNWDNLPYLADGRGLVDRKSFKTLVFARDKGCCVHCNAVAVDAHHLLDRSLFADGGYYLNNGCSLCGDCHLLAEKGELGVAELRTLCGITTPVLAPGVFPDREYDKWGNTLGV